MTVLFVFIAAVLAVFIFLFYIAFFRVMLGKNLFRYSKIEIKHANGVDYLLDNGTPYHTHFLSSDRTKISLNENWKLSLQDAMVDLPHCFNTADSTHRDYVGDVIYEKQIDVSAFELESECSYHLVFEGSFLKTRVFINEQLIGKNNDGYLPFRFDISEVIKKNIDLNIKVLVNNEPGAETVPPLLYEGHPLGFHGFGGIHKEVYIEKCPPIYCFKCHAQTDPSAQQNNVKLMLGFITPARELASMDIDIQIVDNKQQVVFSDTHGISSIPQGSVLTVLKELHIQDPSLWSHTEPNLYTLRITTPYETFSVTFGFRRVEASGQQILLNGRKILLSGVCKHEEDIENGLAESKEAMDRDMKLICELNANFVRLSHYPHNPYFLDKCDSAGVMSWCEIPLYQAGLAPIKYWADKKKAGRDKKIVKLLKLPMMIWKTRQLTDPRLLSNARDSLLRMIERDYNHPSILFWGIGNECWTLNPAGAMALSLLKKTVNDYDPSRIAGYAAVTIPFLSSIFERSFKVMNVIGINEYFGWYYGQVPDVSKYLNAVCEKNKKPLMITETGADCKFGEHLSDKKIKRGVSEEYQDHYLKTQMTHLRKNAQFSGISIWVLKDFLCPEYGSENAVPFYNAKGLVDKNHRKKKAFYTVKKLYYEGDTVDYEKEN